MANNIKFDVDLNVKKEGLNNLKQALQEIQKISTSQFASMNNNLVPKEAQRQLNEVKAAATEVEKALKNAFNVDLGTLNIAKFGEELRALDINNIYNQFSKVGSVGNTAFRSLTTQIVSTNMQLKETNHVLDQMATTMANTVRWGITSSIMNSFTGAVQQAYGYVKNLDGSLNDIRIVTGKSADEMARFAEIANDSAQKLGAGTTDYTRAALIYYQQGLADSEAQARAETTLKAANVTGQSAQAVSDQLTAVWNGYKVSAEETELYVDKLAAVAASTASDLEELSTGMSRVASAAANMGVDVDQLNAQLATIISVTRQAPESVGTALRSIYARMSQLKTDGTDEFGVTLGNYTEQMKSMGIEVLDQTGNLRDMGDVIEEVAAKWNGWSKAQQNAAAQAMAGTRQYNNLIALFDGWDKYTEALETSRNAIGTLQEQQDIYMESTSAHLQEMRTAFEGLADSLLNADTINIFAEAMTLVFNRVEDFVDTVGGGGELLVGVFSSLAQVFSKQIASGITSFINNMKIADENAAALQAHLANIDFVKGSEAYQNDAGVRYITDMADEITRYYSVMSEGEINTANSLAEQAADAKVLELQWEANKKEALEYAKTLARTNTANDRNVRGRVGNNGRGNLYTERDLRPDSGGFYGNIKQDLEEVNSVLSNVEKNVSKVSGEFSKWDETADVKKLNTQFKSLSQSIEDTRTIMKRLELDPKLVPAVQKFNDVLRNAGITADMTGQQLQDALVQAFQNGDLDKGAISRLLAQMRQIGGIGQEQMSILQRVINMTDEEIEKFATDSEKAKAAYQNFVDEQKLKATISGITQLIGAASQLSFVITTVGGIFRTWGDDTLSVNEKITRTITTVLALAPALLQMSKSLREAGTAFGLLTIEKIKESTATAGATATELAHVGALKLVETQSGKTMIATQLLNREIMLNPYVLAAAAIIGLVTALFSLADAQNKAAKATIDANNKIIDEENKKQEEIESNGKLYDSLEELRQKYEEGDITRSELKGSIEDLIEQYGLEGQAADNLRGSYDNLAEAIRQARLAQAEERLASAERERDAARENATIGLQSVNDFDNKVTATEGTYQMTLNAANGFAQSAGFENSFKDEPEELRKALSEFASAGGDGTGLLFQTQDGLESVIELYGNLTEVYEEFSRKLTPAQKQESELFQSLGDWLTSVGPALKAYDSSLEDVSEATAEVAALNAELDGSINFDETKVDGIINYIKEREALVSALIEGGVEAGKAEEQADNYLRKNYEDTYNRYDELAKFFEDFSVKNGGFIDELVEMTDQFDEDQLALFLSIDPDIYKNWDNLAFILDTISQLDFSNVKELAGLTPENVEERYRSAAENYNLYNDVGTSVDKGKTISAKVYDQLDEYVQEFFTMTANGQYKMTQDAKEFYQAINAFKIEGFVNLLNSLKEQIESLNTLKEQNFDYDNLNRQAVSAEPEEGQIGPPQEQTIDYDLVGQQLEYLAAVSDTNSELGLMVELWRQQSQVQSLTLEDVQKIAEAVANVGDKTKSAEEDAEVLRDKYKEVLDQLRAAADTLDEDVDEQAFEDLSEILLEDTDTLKELTHALDDDFRDAAEEVSEAVLRFDDAIVDITDHYEDWMKALKSDALQDSADVLDDIRDMYGDLLDIDPSVLSSDFLRDTSNLEAAKDALNGVEGAYEDLQEAATNDIVIHARLAEGETEDSIFNRIAYLQAKLDEVRAQGDLEFTAYLHSEGFKQALQDLVNAVGADAATAQALLANALSIDATCTEHEQNTDEVQEVNGFEPVFQDVTASFSAPVMEGTDVVDVPGQYIAQKMTYQPTPGTITSHKQNKTYTTSVDNVNGTSVGGDYKFKQATHGGGSKGGGGGGGGGRKGGGGGGKKGKTYTPKEIDVKSKKSDRYHDINLKIDKITRKYDKLAKAQEKLTGKELLKNLDQQLKNLDKQIKLINKRIQLEKKEARELKKELKKEGFKFDDEGYITNYNKVLNKEYKKLETLQKQYNKATTEEAQNALDKQIKAQEKYIAKMEENVKRYDEVKFTDIPDDRELKQELKNQKIETKIAKFNYTIEVRIDWSEAIRDYNEFKEKVDKDFFEPKGKDGKNLFEDREGTIANANRALADYKSFYDDGTGTGGVIQHTTEHLGDILSKLNDINTKGKASVYSDNKEKLLEDLDTYQEQLMDSLEELEDLEEEVRDDYLDLIDEATDAFDDQVDTYEYINDMLEHDMNVMGLLYGDEAYAQMVSYYDQMEKNNNQELDFLKKRAAYAKEMYETETDPEAKEKWKEEWLDAQSEVNSKFEEQLELILDKYTNAVNLAFQELNDKLSGGLGMDFLGKQWDLMETYADEYLDTVNSIYGIQQLQSKYENAIDSTDDVAMQNKLRDIMESELAILRERDHLSQYDLDRANKRYEIALKQMALEDAQQNKSKLRLRRDSQGNYSYQFVEDQEETDKLRDELATLKNELYNMDLEKYKDNLNKIYEYNQQYQEDIIELELETQQKLQAIRNDSTLSEEERAQKEKEILENQTEQEREIRERYEQLINQLVEDNLYIRENLRNSAAESLKETYKGNETAFSNMTGHNLQEFLDMDGGIKKDMMDVLVPAWDSGLQHMTDEITKEGGLEKTYQATFEKLKQATNEYQEAVSAAAEAAGVDLKELTQGYDKNAEAIKTLVQDNDALINKYKSEIDYMRSLISQLEELKNKYDAARQAALDMIDAAQRAKAEEAKSTLGNTPKTTLGVSSTETKLKDKDKNEPKKALEDLLNNQNKGNKGNKSNSGSGSKKRTDKENYGVAIAIWNGGYGWGNDPQRSQRLKEKGFDVNTIRNIVNNIVNPAVKSGGWENRWYGINASNLSQYAYSRFLTGGYTGKWGPEGKLAVLHEKELVLNKQDTQNILDAVNVVRSMSGILNSLSNSMNGRIAGMLGMMHMRSGLPNGNQAVEQTVHITAEFPSVRESTEIETALNNLVNRASQYAFKNKP